MSLAPPPPTRLNVLELVLPGGGGRFPCRDGDVIGREGTVATTALARAGTLSRRHLRVEWRQGAWELILEPSARNETLLDGRPLRKGSPQPLTPGEHRVDVEDFGFGLHVADPAAASAAGSGLGELDALAQSLPGLPGLGRLRPEFGGGDRLLRLIADNVDELIAVIDDRGRRVWNNAAYFTYLGYRPERLRDTDSMADLHPDDAATVRASFAESMRTGVGRRLEYRMRHHAGHWVSLESQGRVVEADAGGDKYLVLVARDVTERRAAEDRARRRVQRLTERAATLAALTQSTPVQNGELERCFATVARAAVDRFEGCARAGVWMFAADGQTLESQEWFEAETLAHRRGPALPAAGCAEFLAALRMERCVAADDARTDERLRGLRTPYLEPAGVSSLLAVHLGLGTESLGMLALERTEAAEGWTLEDQGFAVSLADVLVLAVQTRRREEAFRAMEESQRELAAELAEAARYVRALLPTPMTGEVESEWRFVPCTALGGDGFGHHWIDGEHLAIYLVDVVGHGVGAALLSSSALNVLRTGSLPGVDLRRPAAVLGALNQTFDMETQGNLFFTIWYGVYDRGRRELAYAAAGHPPAVLLATAGTPGPAPALLGTPGLMIGADLEAVFHENTALVPAGAQLYVFSDGAFEILPADGQPWGFDRFVGGLGKPPRPGLSELDGLHRHIQELHGRPELPDDFSILRLRFH